MINNFILGIIFNFLLFSGIQAEYKQNTPQIDLRLLAASRLIKDYYIICTLHFTDADGDIQWSEPPETSARIKYTIHTPDTDLLWGWSRKGTDLPKIKDGIVYLDISSYFNFILDSLSLTISLIDAAGNESNVITKSVNVTQSGLNRIDVSADSVNFEDTIVGSISEQTLMLSNIGTSDLIVHYFINDSIFSINSDSIITIAPLDSHQLKIIYRPNSIGEHRASLLICSNDRFNQVINVILIGKGLITAVHAITDISRHFSLSQNYPNPFNSNTMISYSLPKESKVNLSIFNLSGQLVEVLINDKQKKGFYSVIWNADNLCTGQYFYLLKTETYISIKKMLYVK
jgi:hypothetical protein